MKLYLGGPYIVTRSEGESPLEKEVLPTPPRPGPLCHPHWEYLHEDVVWSWPTDTTDYSISAPRRRRVPWRQPAWLLGDY